MTAHKNKSTVTWIVLLKAKAMDMGVGTDE